MPDQNRTSVRYPLQKRLFDELRQIARQQGKDFVQQYMEVRGLSKTPTYERLAGKTAISFDEGYTLMIEARAQLSSSVQLVDQAQASLHLLEVLRGEWAKRNAQLVLSLEEPPLFYLMHSPILACFHLFIAEWLDGKAAGRQLPVFDQDYCQRRETLEALQIQEQIFQRLALARPAPRCEIWSPNLLNRLSAAARALYREGALPDGAAREMLEAGFRQFIAALEASVRQHRVWLNPFAPAGSQFIYQAESQSLFCAWLGQDSVLYCRQPQACRQAAARLDATRRAALHLRAGQAACQTFFSQIGGMLELS